jgi:hypothetical protein
MPCPWAANNWRDDVPSGRSGESRSTPSDSKAFRASWDFKDFRRAWRKVPAEKRRNLRTNDNSSLTVFNELNIAKRKKEREMASILAGERRPAYWQRTTASILITRKTNWNGNEIRMHINEI